MSWRHKGACAREGPGTTIGSWHMGTICGAAVRPDLTRARPSTFWRTRSTCTVNTDCTFENQSYRASGLNLAIAAIVYWNTVYMQRAVGHLTSTGVPVADHLLAHTSPLGWSPINMTGDYLREQAAIA